MRKRPYLSLEMCKGVIAKPIDRVEQEDGRIRFWGRVLLPGDTEERILRVVTLQDGRTVHNAFIDRGYREKLI